MYGPTDVLPTTVTDEPPVPNTDSVSFVPVMSPPRKTVIHPPTRTDCWSEVPVFQELPPTGNVATTLRLLSSRMANQLMPSSVGVLHGVDVLGGGAVTFGAIVCPFGRMIATPNCDVVTDPERWVTGQYSQKNGSTWPIEHATVAYVSFPTVIVTVVGGAVHPAITGIAGSAIPMTIPRARAPRPRNPHGLFRRGGSLTDGVAQRTPADGLPIRSGGKPRRRTYRFEAAPAAPRGHRSGGALYGEPAPVPGMPLASVRRPTVRAFTLENGLEVRLSPARDSPTASVWVWYRVGSKNERPGITGASHWVEHMLFEGSPRYPKGAIDRAVIGVGGELNAFTDSDFTAYFTTVPREHLGVPLDIEADRMTRALITDDEVARERTVIFSEREGNDNWPEFRVDEELFSLAFRVHPYGWDALGRRADIQNLTAEELRQYYHRFYGTRNAVLVVAGGFEPEAVASDIRERFSGLPGSGEDVTVREAEPPALGPRSSDLTGPGTTPYVEIGWRAPGISEEDVPATIVLDAILGGETPLFAAGGRRRHPEHPDSRLHRALVDPGLAVRASSQFRLRLYPSLFTVQAQAARGISADRLERRIDDVVRDIARRGPTPQELAGARVRIERGAAMAYEGATHTGFRLGFFSVIGPPGFEDRLYRSVLRVTAREVRERAAELFDSRTRLVVRYEPTGGRDLG
jgi:zinc protease